jgi:3-oxoacyl-[acyl-carrier protein] reductase
MIETEGVVSAGFNEGDFRKWVEGTSPLGRIGQTDDISPTAVYLASADSKYLTGETIRVTGGMF